MSVLKAKDPDTGEWVELGKIYGGWHVKTVNGIAPDENGNVQIPVSGGNADIDAAVAKYLTENPVTGGMTQTEKNLILTLFRNAAYTSGNMNATLAQLETIWSGSGGGTEPDVPVNPEKTLSSISAVYSGGSVTAGTSVNALTGIVVTAHYSDGTSASVTGYTLSGTIAEGSNTITVSYGGRTTTFTVTGVAESGGEIVNLFDKNTMVTENYSFHDSNYCTITTHVSRDLIEIPIDIAEDTWFCISNSLKPASGWKGYEPTLMVASAKLTNSANGSAFVRKYNLNFKDLRYGDERTGAQAGDNNVITQDTTGIGVAFLVPATAKYIYINETHGNNPESWTKLMVETGKTCHDYVDYVG